MTDPGEDAGFRPAVGEVGQEPDEDGHGQDDRTRLPDEGNCPPPDDVPDRIRVGAVIEGEFHDEGGRLLLHEEVVNDHSDGAQDEDVEGDERPNDEGRIGRKDGGGDEGEDRKARRAGDEGGQQHREEAGLFRLDDPDAHDRRDVATEADAHRDEALAVEPHEVHEAIHHKGGPGHVTHVLEEGQGGEEDQQDREKGQDRPHASDHPADQQPPEPVRRGRQKWFDVGGETADEPFQEFLERETDLVGQEKDAAEDGEEDRNTESRAGQDVVDPVGHDNLAHPEPGDAGARDLLDPVVPAADDGVEGILMGDEERTDLPPYRCGGQPLHHRRDLRVPLHEFGGDPGYRVRGVHRIPDQGRQLLKELAVILSDQRKFRQGLHLPAGDGDDPLNELPDAAVFCRDHRDDR